MAIYASYTAATVDPWEVVATFAAAIAALAALGAVWLAWRSLGEARTSGKDLSHTAATVGNLLTQAEQSAKDLQAAGDTLREVIAQERELVSLQGDVIGGDIIRGPAASHQYDLDLRPRRHRRQYQ